MSPTPRTATRAPPGPDSLDRLFHALADTSRRRIVDRLSRGPAPVTELAQPFDMKLPSVMKHLGVLESGGLVVSQKVGRSRVYRLVPGGLSAVERWVVQRKAVLEAQFDRLGDFLAQHDAAQKR